MWELRNLDTGEVVIAKRYLQRWAYRFVATNLLGDQYWYKDSKLHREGGPAAISSGNEYWFIEGNFHRDHGPATVLANGGLIWQLDGEYHREDGPAVRHADGREEWWTHGERIVTPCGS